MLKYSRKKFIKKWNIIITVTGITLLIIALFYPWFAVTYTYTDYYTHYKFTPLFISINKYERDMPQRLLWSKTIPFFEVNLGSIITQIFYAAGLIFLVAGRNHPKIILIGLILSTATLVFYPSLLPGYYIGMKLSWGYPIASVGEILFFISMLVQSFN